MLLRPLARLGPEAAATLAPALAATARTRALIGDATFPAAPAPGRRWQDGLRPGDRPEDWAERDLDVAEALWWREYRGRHTAGRPWSSAIR
ncbi:hypothetical protein [Kitasatospora sp. NPDC059327]|uniref:hypothetical protein n=1 Tax=Kitasatospora sp. NPDC059327 TaxID=3346803 RepID=UPI0036BFE960